VFLAVAVAGTFASGYYVADSGILMQATPTANLAATSIAIARAIDAKVATLMPTATATPMAEDPRAADVRRYCKKVQDVLADEADIWDEWEELDDYIRYGDNTAEGCADRLSALLVHLRKQYDRVLEIELPWEGEQVQNMYFLYNLQYQLAVAENQSALSSLTEEAYFAATVRAAIAREKARATWSELHHDFYWLAFDYGADDVLADW